MSVLVVRERPLENVDLYDGLSVELGLHTAADLDPGCRMHAVAGTAAARLLIAEVWESRDAFARHAAERFEPAARSFGLTPSDPLIMPLHRHVASRNGAAADVLAFAEEPQMSAADHDRAAAFALTRSAVAHAVGVANGGIVTVEAWTSAEACADFRRRVLARAHSRELAEPRVEPLFRLLERQPPSRSSV